MKGNEGPNLTGRRGNCAKSTEIELLRGNVPAQQHLSMPRKRFAMPSQCRCALLLDRSTKDCRGKSPHQAFLSLWTLFAALCCEELLAGCRFLEVGRGCFFFFPFLLRAHLSNLLQSLPIPLSVILKAELSVTVLRKSISSHCKW